MSDLNDIVQIVITRETQTVSRAGFGTPGIIAEFDTDKTTVTFDRFREYATLTEMSDDGWGVYDPVYLAAQKIFSQNPRPSKVMVGRKDSGDASFTAALTAIKTASNDWYAFGYVDGFKSTVTFSADFVTGNSIVATINGTAVTAVPFNTNMQTTMGDLETQIEAEITGAAVTIGGSPYRTMEILITNNGANERVVASFVITGGASQPTYTDVETTLIVDQDRKDIAAWTETEKKLYWWNSSAAAIYDSGSTTDIAAFLAAQNYDRSIGMFYKDSDLSFIEFAWMGEGLPYDPGSQTWAYKTLAGVASYSLTSSQRTVIIGKNCGIYTETAGVDITEEGKVASGEWIDIMRGLDQLEAAMKENIFAELVNVRKIPYTDGGITVVEGIVTQSLNDSADDGVLIKESIVVTVPALADISSTDKNNRLLPDITFEALLQGAIHKVSVSGTVSV